MQPSAFVRPPGSTVLRALRVLTRLAMAALVLTLTFGAATAATVDPGSPVALQVRPAATAGPSLPPVAVRGAEERTRVAGQPPREAAAAAVTDARTVAAPVRTRPARIDTRPGDGGLGLRGPPYA